jgi:hypothetical protein
VAIDMQDMGVVILWSEIVTLSLYDENIYRAFQAVGPPRKRSLETFRERWASCAAIPGVDAPICRSVAGASEQVFPTFC